MARHARQRLASPSRRFSSILHLMGIASFSASFWYMTQYPTPLALGFGGSFQFLTIIGLALAFITFVFGLLADITLSDQLFDAKNFVSICAAPLEVLVSILYWGLCAIDRNLVMPPDVVLPILPDVGFHAMPAVMLAADLLLLSPPWTIKMYGAMALSLALAFLYWGWIEYCFAHNGWYPYPIFTMLQTWQRVILFCVAGSLMTGSTMALKWVYGRINGVEGLRREALNPIKLD